MKNIIKRSFVIGDSWLYYKLYTGPKTADLILTEIINPIAQELLDNDIIEKWFFIRYADPKYHLRVRFHYNNPSHILEIISRLHEPFENYLEKDLLWQIQLDTYHRELERYGTKTIELSEMLFFHDSKMIVNFLNLIEGDDGENIRWLFGLRAIENLLSNFEYGDKEKLKLLEKLKTDFGIEFGMSRYLKKQLDEKYRTLREDINDFMVFTKKTNPNFKSIIDVLDDKTNDIKDIVVKILEYNKNKLLQMELDDLISSYIHMLMNRLFKSNNRLNEMVCYDFLYRYYKSVWARKNYN